MTKKLMMMVAAVAAALGAWAETETVGDYTWTYWINGDTAQILGVSPSTGAVTIPSTLSGKPVTSIGSDAFYNCSGLTSVTIPNSVTSIGGYAFYGCRGLTSVTIPDSVTCIGDSAFSGCSGLTSITIPSSVKRIEYGAFEDCSGLTSVTIPSSVTEIGSCAFAECKRLANVTINGSNTFIGGGAFACCTNLTDVTMPIGLKGISPNAFLNDEFGQEEQTPFAFRLEAAKAVVASKFLSGDLSLETTNPRYNLTQAQEDRAISSMTINSDTALSNFTLSNGKVYDTVIRIVNTSANAVRVTLPSGYEYETVKGANPLTIPANSKNILTITRTMDNVFLVSRRELETVR